MIVFYKNYKRTDRVLLSIQSVKHLYPEMDIRCLHLYDDGPAEYDAYTDKFNYLGVQVYLDKKTYNFGNPSAAGSANNGYYFTEGINKIFQLVSNVSEKVFILDEDQFFTTGATLRFLLDSEFDLAYSYWGAPTDEYMQTDPDYKFTYPTRPTVGINGAFLAIVPTIVSKYFPLPEKYEYIEILLGHELHDRCISDNLRVVNIPTRYNGNYHGDGVHTNDIDVIKTMLTRHKIGYSL